MTKQKLSFSVFVAILFSLVVFLKKEVKTENKRSVASVEEELVGRAGYLIVNKKVEELFKNKKISFEKAKLLDDDIRYVEKEILFESEEFEKPIEIDFEEIDSEALGINSEDELKRINGGEAVELTREDYDYIDSL